MQRDFFHLTFCFFILTPLRPDDPLLISEKLKNLQYNVKEIEEKVLVQRITSHSARTFSECEPRPAFAPKTCASWFQPHEIPGLSRSQFLLTVFLRNPVTFKGVDWKRQPRTQQLLPWALYTCWKKRKTCNLPREFGETKASVEEASSVFLREHSSSAFSLWFQRASEEKSVWPEPSSVFQGEGKWDFWLLLRLDFCCSKEEICC